MRSALLALAVMLTAALTMSVDADVPEVRVRMPFSEIMNNQAYAKQRDLLILSLERLKELDPDNIDSWYARAFRGRRMRDGHVAESHACKSMQPLKNLIAWALSIETSDS